jgi:hypothetical protein
MAALYGTLCTIPPRNSNQYFHYCNCILDHIYIICHNVSGREMHYLVYVV